MSSEKRHKLRTVRSILLLVLFAALVPAMAVQGLLHVQRFKAVQAREIRSHTDIADSVPEAGAAAYLTKAGSAGKGKDG